jgi:hypothetical protein
MWCSFVILPDWGVFLTDLGYDANNPGDKAVIDALKGKKTTPGKLASLWTEDVPLKECEDWLKGEGINSGGARTHIISGIKDLAPKGLLLPVYYSILCLF